MCIILYWTTGESKNRERDRGGGGTGRKEGRKEVMTEKLHIRSSHDLHTGILEGRKKVWVG
jgi:hypothetical protein